MLIKLEKKENFVLYNFRTEDPYAQCIFCLNIYCIYGDLLDGYENIRYDDSHDLWIFAEQKQIKNMYFCEDCRKKYLGTIRYDYNFDEILKRLKILYNRYGIIKYDN